MVFPAINRWLRIDVVETGDKFSIIYVFITISVSNACSKFDVGNSVFHYRKTKLGIQGSVFRFSNVKKENKISHNHIFKNSFN